MNYVNKLEDLPNGEHWVIVKDLSVHHEGDERSRTAPGHGYPAHTDNYVQVYESFTDEETFKSELEKEIRNVRFGGRTSRGFKVIPYVVKTTVEITASSRI